MAQIVSGALDIGGTHNVTLCSETAEVVKRNIGIPGCFKLFPRG